MDVKEEGNSNRWILSGTGGGEGHTDGHDGVGVDQIIIWDTEDLS